MSDRRRQPWILYSTCDEDAYSELTALDVQPSDDVLSVTGSGCRSLSLLSLNPRSLTTVDYSPGQNHLFELKLAAIRRLTYDSLLEFLGVHPSRARWRIFQELQADISPAAARYFTSYRNKIESGVLMAGRHEQFYRRIVAPLLKLLYGDRFDRIFACDTLAEQVRLYDTTIQGPLWRTLIRQGFSVPVIKAVLSNKDYNIEINVGAPGPYILRCLDHTFHTHLARDNDWLSMTLRGRYGQALPQFITRAGYDGIRRADTRVRVETGNLIGFCAAQGSARFDKLSLSDVTSCITRAEFEQLMVEVARIGRPGGRMCVRNFLAGHQIPPGLSSRLRRNDETCVLLDQRDKAFAYKFEVAEFIAEDLAA
jgi:S-adenosylmethionine-diacylglycerol 3-amino-3-carboxypropyl transferase